MQGAARSPRIAALHRQGACTKDKIASSVARSDRRGRPIYPSFKTLILQGKPRSISARSEAGSRTIGPLAPIPGAASSHKAVGGRATVGLPSPRLYVRGSLGPPSRPCRRACKRYGASRRRSDALTGGQGLRSSGLTSASAPASSWLESAARSDALANSDGTLANFDGKKTPF